LGHDEGAVSRACRILLVEDDLGVQELLQHILTDEGNEVVVAKDGPSTQAALETGNFNAAIIDFRLPGSETGLSLAQQAADRGCGVVLITADHLQDEALAASGHRYLLKPFRVEALLEATQRAVEAVQARCNIRRDRRVI